MEITALDAVGVLDHLRERGFDLAPDSVVAPLPGGVSGEVFIVRSGADRWVVKQPLAQLRVATAWFAKPERAATEAAAMEVLGDLTPANVPQLLDFDDGRLVIVMTAAPPDWKQWKESLLAETIGRSAILQLAVGLGGVLGAWHRDTWGVGAIAARFDDDEAFEQLRVDPFLRVTQQTHPDLPSLAICIEELATVRQCLVHGDFSPKNVLWSDAGFWVLDFEVARFGAAVFDPAMLVAHLAAKAIHQPERARLLRDAGDRFVATYASTVGTADALTNVAWHTAAILLARIDGRSPVGYLSERGQRRARIIARLVLSLDEAELADLWGPIIEEAP